MKLLFHGVGIYPPAANFGPACWPHPDLFVVREGELLFQTYRGEVRLAAGDAVLIPPKVEFHGMAEAQQVSIWVCHFRSREIQSEMNAPEFVAGVGLFRAGARSELANELMDRLHQIYQGNARWSEHAETYFAALLAEISRNARMHSDLDHQWFRELERWTREHLGERLGVREMAREAGLSVSHFRKLFLQRRGISVGKFLRELRLNEAKTLLHQSSLNLKEIAARVGYSDAVAFHHAFITRFRTTPTAFRQSLNATL